MIGLANKITMARAVLTLGVWGALAYAREVPALHEDSTFWFVLSITFVITATTDILDGYLARRWGDVSLFGRVMDPLVDKMLTLGSMIVLLPRYPSGQCTVHTGRSPQAYVPCFSTVSRRCSKK